MPYPNEHACRIREPSEFEEGSFRRGSRESGGKSYGVIYGRLKGRSSVSEQAYRYPKDGWSADEARSHCERHKGRTFEPATGGEKKAETMNSTMSTMTVTGNGDMTVTGFVSTIPSTGTSIAPKEVKPMTRDELKQNHPDVYAAIIAEGKAEMMPTVEALQTKVTGLEESEKTLKQQNAQLDKDLTIERSNRVAERETSLIGKTMDDILAESKISPSLHDKVKKQIDYRTYKNGDEVTATSEAYTAFVAAFKAEVSDWESKLPAGAGGAGVTEPKEDVVSDAPKSAFGDENRVLLGLKK